MPGLPQNDNKKPNLSFSGTKALRDLMLSKNLPNPTTTPYFDKRNTGPDDFTDGQVRVDSLRDLAVPNQPTVDEQAEFYIDKAYLANAYGPSGGFSDWIQIYDASQKIAKVNEGEYPDFTAPETGAGLFGANPFRTVAKYYSPIDILLGVTAEGLLSTTLLEDSALQQQGALALRREFQSRIQQELYQETIGRLNFVDALKDPFKALDIVTGRESLIERDNNITVPKSLVGKGLDFVSRLTGVYVPYSYIPGDYFELEPPRGLGTAGKIISDVTGILGSLIGIPRRRQSPSQRFLDYTGGASKNQLFKHIRYNVYGPQYGEGAQAQTAIGAGFGEAIDFIKGGILGAGNFPPNPPQYVGGPRNRIADMTSPPESTYAGKNYVPQFGPDAVAKEFDSNEYDFGMKGRTYINQGNVPGGFTWFTDSSGRGKLAEFFGAGPGPQEPGTSQGAEGSTDDTKEYQTPPDYDRTKSTNYDFRDDSVMDVTQQIIDSVPKGGAKLKSVSHAMNQVSKVFNDGYKELTKGSRVRTYINTDPINEEVASDKNKPKNGVGRGAEVAREYCRVWTKDIPYYTYGRLMKTRMNHRKETYSVLDSPYNLNIAPWRTDETGKGSTNIVGGKVKKYMFSLENLAWRTSSAKGLTYDDLPTCEKGPNGGRIMWFPPYDLQVDESSNANWTENNFVGRPEPVYTYNNTNRTGTLRFKIVVDHPSILNLIVRKYLKNMTPEETDGIVDSFFAGCKNFDIYDLARKWPQFSVNELADLQEQLDNPNLTKEGKGKIAQDTITDVETVVEPTPEIPNLDDYKGLTFYFQNDQPNPNSRDKTSKQPFNILAGDYLTVSARDTNVGEALEQDKDSFRNFYNETMINHWDTKWPAFAKELYKILTGGLYKVRLSFKGAASSIASNDYNYDLSLRRLDAVKQLFENYTLGNENAFKEYMTKDILTNFEGQALGESICNSEQRDANGDISQPKAISAVYSQAAAQCRKVWIDNIEFEKIDVEEEEVQLTPPPNPPIIRKDRPLAKKKKEQKLISKNTRREIANTVLMKMVTECDYFDLIKEENEFIYDRLSEKFKFFQPAFHSITPEGLNSRLTFLNQCVRPGATIPTKQEGGGLSTGVDAKNTAFGAPPICVLRIGDFYHTKIAIGNIGFAYDDNLLDLNPEGIGVQPMIASVTLTFNYLGGQGIKEPVNRLQNALSFNYYANTEMYDSRSILTVTDEDPDEAAWLKENADLVGTTQETGSGDPEEAANKQEEADTSPNDGFTIGNRENQVLTESGETGTIKYDTKFNELNSTTYNYFHETHQSIYDVMSTLNYGVIQVYFSDKIWNEGEYYEADIDSSSANFTLYGELIGIGKDYDARLTEIVNIYRGKIKSETTYIQAEFLKTNPSGGKKRKLKKFLEQKLTNADADLRQVFSDLDEGLKETHLNYIKEVNAFNVVNRYTDGFIENGKTTVFRLSGGTPVYETSSLEFQPTAPLNTLKELGNDYKYLTNSLSCYSKIMNGSILVDLNGYNTASAAALTQSGKYNSNPGGINFIQTSDESPKLNQTILFEYFLFSEQMIDKNTVAPLNVPQFKEDNIYAETGEGEFFTELKTALGISEPEPIWISDMRVLMNQAIAENENFYLTQLWEIQNDVIYVLAQIVDDNVLADGLASDSDLGTKGDTSTRPVISKDKPRELLYEKESNGVYEEYIREYNSDTNSDNDTFNLKFN